MEGYVSPLFDIRTWYSLFRPEHLLCELVGRPFYDNAIPFFMARVLAVGTVHIKHGQIFAPLKSHRTTSSISRILRDLHSRRKLPRALELLRQLFVTLPRVVPQ